MEWRKISHKYYPCGKFSLSDIKHAGQRATDTYLSTHHVGMTEDMNTWAYGTHIHIMKKRVRGRGLKRVSDKGRTADGSRRIYMLVG